MSPAKASLAAIEVEARGDGRAREWLPWSADGAGLRAWRDRLGWTQAAAAGALGLSLRAYGDAEGGRAAVRRERVLACWAVERLRSEGRGVICVVSIPSERPLRLMVVRAKSASEATELARAASREFRDYAGVFTVDVFDADGESSALVEFG